MSHAAQGAGGPALWHRACPGSQDHLGVVAVSAFITTAVCVIKSETFQWEKKENISSLNFPWLCWGSDSCLQEVFVQGAVHSSSESSTEYSPSLPLLPSHPREFSLLTGLCVFSGSQRLYFFSPSCASCFSPRYCCENDGLFWLVLNQND